MLQNRSVELCFTAFEVLEEMSLKQEGARCFVIVDLVAPLGIMLRALHVIVVLSKRRNSHR